MKKSIHVLILSTLAIFTMSCDEETLAALTELIAGTPGCTIEQNDNYNPEATMHVADSCATQIFGCTNSEALNYVEGATHDDDSCNLGIAGCTDPNLANYNPQATISVSDSCGTATSTAGCTLATACNYNPYATADCSNDSGTTDQTCCQPKYAVADTSIACYQDANDNGYHELMITMTVDNCGCGDLNTFDSADGYGWSDESNGAESAGCMDPACPEYDPDYNVNNYECCITALADSTIFDEDSENYIEELNYTGSYEMIMGSSCGDQGQNSDGDTDKGFIYLGWDYEYNEGIYFTEMEKTHIVTGFPTEPAWDYNASNQNSCEGAAQGGPWWCENDMQGGWEQDFTPCHEMYFREECWTNPECTWQDPQCSEAPNVTHQACYESTSQGSCESNPGCWWEDGIDDGGHQFSEPWCYFDCMGLSTTDCNLTNGECEVKTGGNSWSYCSAPIDAGSDAPGPAQCYMADSGATNGWCEWYPDSDQGDTWDYNIGHCECYGDWGTACEEICTGCSTVTEVEPDFCEWTPQTNSCTAYTSEDSCWNDWENHCFWEYDWNEPSGGRCEQEYWFSEGSSCWDYGWENNSWEYDAYGAEVSCLGNDACSWNDPGADAGNPDWAMPGLCMNWDPCHYIENYNPDGHQNQYDCDNDYNCHWDQGQGGQPGGCYENAYEQWCDCRYEYTSQTCVQAGYTWESFDNFGGQCMTPMDQWTCEYGYMGPGDGYIDCSMYEDVDRFQEWNNGVCTEIKSEFEEGEWYLEGGSLCHTAEEEIDCATISYFEECECERDCHWNNPNVNPQDNPWEWENGEGGECVGHNDGPGGNRAKLHINPRINGTNSIFENVNPTLLQILYSSSPDGFECLPMTLQSNGDILLEGAGDGGCSVTLKKVDDI